MLEVLQIDDIVQFTLSCLTLIDALSNYLLSLFLSEYFKLNIFALYSILVLD